MPLFIVCTRVSYTRWNSVLRAAGTGRIRGSLSTVVLVTPVSPAQAMIGASAMLRAGMASTTMASYTSAPNVTTLPLLSIFTISRLKSTSMPAWRCL